MTVQPVTALTKNKHFLIIALLSAAGEFVSQLVSQGVIQQGLGAAVGALIGEALTYEHSE